MKFLTKKQKAFMIRKQIIVGGAYSFPIMGFTIYAEPNYSSGEELDTNPFTKSLAGQSFLVKKIENGFCKGNFYSKPIARDMYLSLDELSQRNLVEILFLFLIGIIPLTIYNWFRGGVEKIERETINNQENNN
jgi:hypothetical protein